MPTATDQKGKPQKNAAAPDGSNQANTGARNGQTAAGPEDMRRQLDAMLAQDSSNGTAVGTNSPQENAQQAVNMEDLLSALMEGGAGMQPQSTIVPDDVQQALASLLGRDVTVMASMTRDTYWHEPKDALLLSIPVDPNVSSLAKDEQAIKDKLRQIPALADLLTEPMGRQVEDMLAKVTSKDPVKGFTEQERMALSGWKKGVESGEVKPVDSNTIALVLKIDDAEDRAKVAANIASRIDAIGQEMTQNGHMPIQAGVQQTADGIALILSSPQPQQAPDAQNQIPPVFQFLQQPNAGNIVTHAMLYAGEGWQQGFGILSDADERKTYMDFIAQKKSPEVQAMIRNTQQGTDPSKSVVMFPTLEYPNEFRMQLVLGKDRKLDDVYSAILAAANPQQGKKTGLKTAPADLETMLAQGDNTALQQLTGQQRPEGAQAAGTNPAAAPQQGGAAAPSTDLDAVMAAAAAKNSSQKGQSGLN